MKKILLLSSLLVAANAFAQTDDTYTMKLELASGRVVSYPVDNVANITFEVTQPLTPEYNTDDDYNSKTFSKDGDITIVNWPVNSDATPVPEYTIDTKGIPGGIADYNCIVKFSYWSDSPVGSIELRMVQNGSLVFPYGHHCVSTGYDTGSQGGEWKELIFDVSRAWESTAFTQDLNKGQYARIQVNFAQGNSVTHQLKIKDFEILPRISKYCTEVFPTFAANDGYGQTCTDIEGGKKIVIPAQFNNGGTMVDVPEHVVWAYMPFPIPHPDYTLSFSYKIEGEGFSMVNVADHLFRGDSDAADSGCILDSTPVMGEWETVSINMKDAFTNFDYWALKRTNERIRLEFNPSVNGREMTISIKDLKLIPNE